MRLGVGVERSWAVHEPPLRVRLGDMCGTQAMAGLGLAGLVRPRCACVVLALVAGALVPFRACVQVWVRLTGVGLVGCVWRLVGGFGSTGGFVLV